MEIKIGSKQLLKYIILLVLFFGIIYDALKVPGVFIYTTDIALILALILGRRKFEKVFKGFTKKITYYVIFYFLMEFILYLFNYQSLFYFFFGARNQFRFYVFFLLCIYVFSVKDIERLFNRIDYIFYINFSFMLVEYFFMGYKQDFLGGIFGVSQGCNGTLNVFFIIYTSFIILRYLHKQIPAKNLAIKLAVVFFSCAISELKVFFFEILLIVLFSMIFTGFSFRKIALVVFSMVGVLVGVNLLIYFFPDFAGFFSINEVIRITTVSGYSSYNSVNRFTFIPYINRLFLTKPIDCFIGLGLGNCETSSIAFLQTPFFEKYEYIRYYWLTSAHTYLEQGYFGLITYLSFFILLFFSIRKMEKKASNNHIFFQLGEVISLLCLVLFVYNTSLKDEIAYLIFFVLAVPFVVNRENDQVKTNA